MNETFIHLKDEKQLRILMFPLRQKIQRPMYTLEKT